MPGFSDINILKKYPGTSIYESAVVSGVPLEHFKVPGNDILDSASVVWPIDEIVVETTIYAELSATITTVPANKILWDGSNLYIFPDSFSYTDLANVSVVVYRINNTEQTYNGEAWQATTPKAVAEALDKAMRTSQRVLEAQSRSIQIHPADPLYPAFNDTSTHPDDFTLPPIPSRAGKVIGFGSDGKLGYFPNSSAGGVSTPTPDTLVQRDTNGNAQFADPVVSADADTMGAREAAVAAEAALRVSHQNLTNPHSATSAPTPDRLMLRDAGGRSQVATPITADDATPKSYVDNSGGVAASFVPGATVDNQTTFGKVYKIAGAAPTGTESGTSVTDGYQSTELTFNFNTTTPLSGTKDYQITNRVTGLTGAGVYWDFALDPAFRTIPLQITYPYTNQNADGLWKTFIVAYSDAYITPVAVIPISDPSLLTASAAAQFFATFFPTTSQYYRLYLHATTSGTIGQKLNIDNLGVSKQQSVNAAAVGEWADYKTAPTWSGTVPGSWTHKKWRRIGSSMEFSLRYAVTGAVVGSMQILGLSDGYTIRSDMPISNGEAYADNGLTTAPGSTNIANGYLSDKTSVFNATNPFTWANGHSIYVHGFIPIAQWSTNIALASDFTEYAYNTDVTATGNPGGNGAIASSVLGPDGVYFNAAWVVGTDYIRRVRFSRPVQPSDKVYVEAWDGVLNVWVDLPSRSGAFMVQGTTSYGCNWAAVSGSPTDIQVAFFAGGARGTGVTYGSNGSAWAAYAGAWKWRVRKVSGGNMAEQTPAVRARCSTSSAQLITSSTARINFDTKSGGSNEDTNGLVTTGASWKFTASAPGLYQVNVLITSQSKAYTAGQLMNFVLYKNDSSYEVLDYCVIQSNFTNFMSVKGNTIIRLLAGDWIDVRGNRGSQAADYNLHNDGSYNWIDITRVGS